MPQLAKIQLKYIFPFILAFIIFMENKDWIVMS